MSTENKAGPLTRAKNFVLKVVFILVGYTISIAVLMALRGPITASAGEQAFTIIFGTWVIGTLALLGLLTG